MTNDETAERLERLIGIAPWQFSEIAEVKTLIPSLLSERRALREENDRLREALAPFAKAAMGVATFDPDFPADGAALRASFDWYDKAQDEPRKRHSVRRSDLDKCAALLTANGGEHD